MTTYSAPAALLDRLMTATNAHDLDGLVDCFAADYVNETPVHPERGFTGADQVRRNWTQIFAAVPDVHAEVVRSVVDGDTVWAEMEHRGTRPDGSPHVMRGVVVLGVADDRATWARFYLEPVVPGTATIDEVVRSTLAGRAVP
jgi:ketosteroid isomerase-like protein